MKKYLFAILLFIFILFDFTQAQTVINKITFSNTFKTSAGQLVLNGGGTREKYWMDMYVAALYLPEKSKDAPGIVAANSPAAIRICIVSGLITSDKMIKAVNEGFEKSIGGDMKKFTNEIKKFESAFSEPIKVGDVFDIVYTPSKIHIYKNNSLKTEIEGFEFKKAAIGIWLGANPADANLKKGMLGN